MKNLRSLLFLVMCVLLTFSANADRLKVGLVLGGGGAKGAAEIGVLKTLKKAGIPIDYVAGTSVGSLVGGLYASGVDPEKMEELFSHQDWISLFTDRNMSHAGELIAKDNGCYFVYGYPVWNSDSEWRDGLLQGDSITSMLGQLTGHTEEMDFDDLEIPFRCVVVDLENMEEHVLDEGVLPECLRTSMSFPVAFSTQMRDGRKYIDGGAINNLPVDVVKAMGADVVIAVDLEQREKGSRQSGGGWLEWLVGNTDVGSIVNYVVGDNQLLKSEQVNLGNIINWFITNPDDKKYLENKKMVDIYIHPDLTGYNLVSFTPESVSEMIRIGERTALDAMPQLMDLWQRIYLGSFDLDVETATEQP